MSKPNQINSKAQYGPKTIHHSPRPMGLNPQVGLKSNSPRPNNLEPENQFYPLHAYTRRTLHVLPTYTFLDHIRVVDPVQVAYHGAYCLGIFSRSALCNIHYLTSPAVGNLSSSLSTGDLDSSLSTSDIVSSLFTDDLGLTSPHRRLQRLLNVTNPSYD
ncbi:unnamed protein product [Lactuca saligna]|uniref:Uncharacterized protein n=1 Tax=Lactuca saligna TaxID=75948 RepID=A0AA35ZGL3_LACSI|nr:unnamed protein product [Lactuca saligna]